MPARILPHIPYLLRTFIFHDFLVPARSLCHGSAYRGKRKNRYEEGSARRIRHSQAVPEGHPPRRDWAWDASTIPTMPPASGHRRRFTVHSIESPSPATPCKDGTSCIPHDCRMPSCCWRAAIGAVPSACDARALPCGRSHRRWSCGGCRIAWRAIRP